jgi:hypothetical protein
MQQTPLTAIKNRSAATSDSRLYLPVALVDVSQPLGYEASHRLNDHDDRSALTMSTQAGPGMTVILGPGRSRSSAPKHVNTRRWQQLRGGSGHGVRANAAGLSCWGRIDARRQSSMMSSIEQRGRTWADLLGAPTCVNQGCRCQSSPL